MVDKLKSYKKLNDNIYLTSWGIYLFVTLWNQSFFSSFFMGKYYELLLMFCLLLLAFKEIIIFDLNPKTAVIAFGLFLLGVIVYAFSFHKMLFIIMFFIFSARNVDMRKIIDVSMWISVFILCFVSLSALNGIVHNEININYMLERERQFLGFKYVLFPVTVWSNITCLWMLKRKDRITWKEILFFLIINQLLFEYTNSRLVYLIVLMRIFALMMFKSKMKKIIYTKIVKNIMIFSTLIACVFSFYVTMNYDPTDVYQYLINFILEGRLELAQDAIHNYGWPVWGEDIKWVGNSLDENGIKAEGAYNYVDCAYIHFMLEYGIVVSALLMLVLIKLMKKLAKKNEIILMIVFSSLAIHGIIDDLILQLHYNACWLLLGMLIPTKYRENNYI